MGPQCRIQCNAAARKSFDACRGLQAKDMDIMLQLCHSCMQFIHQRFHKTLRAFDKARFRRNESLYGRAGTISESQARNLVGRADVFVTSACRMLKIPD